MQVTSPLVMLHLGLGSFHRAHQAVYLQHLRASGDTRWELCGANLRPDGLETIAALQASNGRYTLETVAPAGERSYEVIESIKRVIAYSSGGAEVMNVGADPSTRIISFTVTEAGYYLDDKDQIEGSAPEVIADLKSCAECKLGHTIYGALTSILNERMKRNAGRVTLLNCDNLRHNGVRARAGLLQFIALLNRPELLAWISANTSSPNAMVDRITPRPTSDVRARVLEATGRDDPAALMGESFIQWVIEDNFCNGRPAFESVGVEMVALVAPYEEAKIRLLNATHSCIAWAGTLLGYRYIHQGTHNPAIRQIAFDYVTDDVIPVISPSPINLEQYRDVVLDRFGNAAIADTNQRVAMDGFSKIPGFIAPTIRERLKRGQSIASVAMLPALFLALLQRWHVGELPYRYEDQVMNGELAHAMCDASDPVAAMVGSEPLWGDLAGDAELIAAIRIAQRRVNELISTHRAAGLS